MRKYKKYAIKYTYRYTYPDFSYFSRLYHVSITYKFTGRYLTLFLNKLVAL